MGSDVAVVRWETAQPLDSTVEFGPTFDLGQSVGGADKVTSHAVKLTHLKPGTRYHYRVKSGPLTYPTSAPAHDVAFLTEPGWMPSSQPRE